MNVERQQKGTSVWVSGETKQRIDRAAESEGKNGAQTVAAAMDMYDLLQGRITTEDPNLKNISRMLRMVAAYEDVSITQIILASLDGYLRSKFKQISSEIEENN